MNIDVVTITGADDSIFLGDILPITKKFKDAPFKIEWGILLSKNSEGSCRFPRKAWLEGLIKLKHYNPDIKLSGHLCGTYVRQLLDGNFIFPYNDVWKLFDRIQLNFHGEELLCHKDRFFDKLIELDKTFIFQADDVNNALFTEAIKRGVKAEPLFDLSHGAGVSPDKWVEPIHSYCGYAGGLGEDNLAEELGKIREVAKGEKIWVDMETKVRSNHDYQFDLTKVSNCLDIINNYLVNV